MATKKKKPAKPKKVVLKTPPADYLRGSKTVGAPYTAWDTYGQGKPDFGKGDTSGPGTPYHEVKKVIKKPSKSGNEVVNHALQVGKLRTMEQIKNITGGGMGGKNAQVEAIRRRLKGHRNGGL